MRRRVRGGRRRAVARPGPAARAGRARGARPPWRVRRPTASRATGPASLLPLERAAARAAGRAGAAGDGPAVVMVFLPARPASRDAGPGARWRGARDRGPGGRRAGGACPSTPARWARRRPRPGRTSPRRSSAARSTPAPAARSPDAEFERRLVLARRRLEIGGAGRWPRRPLGRVGVVPDRRLQGPRRGRPPRRRSTRTSSAPIALSHAVFHQRYATNTTPTWRLAQPFRSLAHNGEINTVRGNREQVRGRTGDAVARRAAAVARELSTPGRCSRRRAPTRRRSTRRSSCSSRPAGTWARRCSPRCPRRSALRRAPHPHAATLRRRTAGFARPVGRPGGARLLRRPPRRRDPRPQRAAAGGLRGDARPARRASRRRRGPIPLAAAETVRRGRLGPGEMLLVDPAARRDPRGRRGEGPALLRSLPIHDAPRPAHEDRAPSAATPRPATAVADCATSPGSTPSGPGSTSRRWSLEAHEPLWSMGDDTPTPAPGRVDRPVADHLRQAFAQVTNPPIDPEREKAVMDLRVELGRRPRAARRPAARTRRSRTIRLNRPVVADRDALLDAFPGRRPPAGSDVAGRRRTRRPRGGPRSTRRSRGRRRRQGRGARRPVGPLVLRARDCRSRRSSPPAPSTPRSPTPASAAGPTSSSTRPTSSTSTRSR